MADDSGEIVREAAESVAFENVKTGGGASSFYQALAMGNAVANQQNGQTLALAILSKAADNVMNTSAEEGTTPSALAQILSKMAGNTPPVTP